MAMPRNLILVRHGESEGNIANKRSRKGDHSAFTEEFKKRHSSQWRLTDKGREQAAAAGQWLKDNIDFRFDRFYVSEYLRAMETAARLGIPDALWRKNFNLRERDWGQLDILSDEERRLRFAEEFARRLRDGFYWAAPGGESMAHLSLRIRHFFDTMHRECGDKNVIVVCHGEVMWMFRVLLEHMSQQAYEVLDKSKDPLDHIHNCQILHYSRICPDTNRETMRYEVMRSICPTDLSLSRNDWQPISRQLSTNEDLMAEVESSTRLIAC